MADELQLKRTPLFAVHQKLGARLVEFGGWEMPVQYTGIVDEHLAVRRAAGIFDISHMGQVRVRGPLALDFLNQTLTNDLLKIVPGHGQYTLMCNERGGVIDDLYVYWIGEHDFLLVINASRIQADVAWLESQLARFSQGKVIQLENVSDRFGAVAVQGPCVAEFLDQCFSAPVAETHPETFDPLKKVGDPAMKVRDLKKNQIGQFHFGETLVWVARTGYTGEDGFEVVAPAEPIEGVWRRIMAAGASHGLKPAGLGARDTLRTEACYPLYGHELDENTTPIEAGLRFFAGIEKLHFVGREVLAAQIANGVTKRCVAFKMTDKSAPPRPHYPIWTRGVDSKIIGEVTSGTQSPSLGIGIGMGYVAPDHAKAGTPIEIEIRGKRCSAVIVAKPIYKRPG